MEDKILKDINITNQEIWDYEFNASGPRYADKILNLYDFTAENLNFKKENNFNKVLKDAALYLVHKT